MTMLPMWILVLYAFLLGAIIGSFIDVLVSRYGTGRSINGRSHCASCGHTLSWYELLPLASYVALRGRCKQCGSHIPRRLLFIEISTGVAFASVMLQSATYGGAAIGLVLAALMMVIALYDMRHMIIPDVFTLLLMVSAGVALLLQFFLWVPAATLWGHIFAGLAATAFYAALWLISRGRWIGLGDVKLALPLGVLLSPWQVFSFVVLSFWIGAGVSVCLLVVQWCLKRGQTRLGFLGVPLTIKSEVPFAPFMLVAWHIVYYFHVDVLQLFL